MRTTVKTETIQIHPLTLTAKLIEGSATLDNVTIDSHIHNECEIYVNLTGDVSFMVENRIYRVKSGDVIITRPHEAHHCILHNTHIHDHFCITFTSENNEEILSRFFVRNAGDENYISLSEPLKKKLIKLCYSLVEEENKLNKHIAFFCLIDMLTEEKSTVTGVNLPEDVEACIEYINKNLSGAITVKDLADYAHVTVNTLERHFKKYTGLSPYTYIQNCRLVLAVSILEKGGTVTRAAADSGFPDYSHFIALFRKIYGKTPLQFKKEL